MEVILSVSDLGVRYPQNGTDAVSGLSFDVRPGEFLALLGPSGSGKTTALRAIAGFEPIDSGRIELRGETVAGDGKIVGNTIEHRLQKNLAEFGHGGVQGWLHELYRDVVARRRAVGASTYYFNARHNKCQLWTVQAPLCNAAGDVAMLIGVSLILPVSVN